MYEELSEPLPDLGAYLERIGYQGPVEPTASVLDAVVYAHLTHVPFENIDVYERRLEPSLAIRDLFDKIVVRGCGGYCFELNALFSALLRAIGFEVLTYAGHVVLRRLMPVPPDHRCVVAMVNGERRWCDVGFGGPAPACSLLVDYEGVQHTARGDFSFDFDGTWHTLYAHLDGKAVPTVCFADRLAEDVDFVPLNYYTSMRDESPFRQRRMAYLLTDGGKKSINGDVFRMREGDALTERAIQDEGQLAAIWEEHFGITL